MTIVSFGTFTKWWYVLPVDAPDTMMVGFPFAFAADGWATSLSLQIFMLELVVDFLIYFLFWFLIIMLIDRFIIRIKIVRILTGVLWIFSTILFSFAVWIASFPEQDFEKKRDWDMRVLETGYKLTWTYQDRPDFKKFEK
jgi:hypothetical protein